MLTRNRIHESSGLNSLFSRSSGSFRSSEFSFQFAAQKEIAFRVRCVVVDHSTGQLFIHPVQRGQRKDASKNFTAMLQEASMSSRTARAELAKEKNVNPNGDFVLPILESSKFGKSKREVAKQEDGQRKRVHPWLIRRHSASCPIENRLYDASFAAKGLPVDPHLRMLMENPDFLKIEGKPKADGKNKMVIDLNN